YTDLMASSLLGLQDAIANLVRDLSRRNAELVATRERLEEVAALRDEFLATLSHDLKTPLMTIKLQLAAVERSGIAAEQPATLSRIQSAMRSADRMRGLIDDLLDAACLEAGTVRIDAARISVADAARETAESLEPLSMEAEVRIEVSAPSRGLIS